MRPWQRRAGFQSQTSGALPSFTAFLPCRIAPPLMACKYPTHLSRLSPNTLSHGTILDSSLFLLGSVYISHFSWRTHLILLHHLYMCTWLLTAPGRVRSVHQPVFLNLMLIIANAHTKLHSKCWPRFTDEETETEWGPHHWSAFKQKSWNLNQLMSVQILLLFHIMLSKWWMKVCLKWKQHLSNSRLEGLYTWICKCQ